ncbi:hypothetical protein HDV62DRAFT_361719 [Trichoderma sp. SZMC 28011]
MSNPNDYTVGWISAITTEYVAARAVLDEIHEGPDMVSTNDSNNYTLGRIGKHNVVIAVLPDGEYGISSAARVAADLSHSFPNVRFGLLVGIGGGAPSRKNDIRLGDVVVSSPGSSNGVSHSGVFQYDFGKTIQGQSFQTTGFLNQPPFLLRAAVTGVKARYEEEGHRIKANIGAILDKNPRLRKKYQQPDPSSDRLYHSYIYHPTHEEHNCAMSCGNTLSSLIFRPERGEYEDDPMIHYGLVASANQLMEDAVLRDKLATENDVKCFETEAAGLMNHFPCLVIRSICDYADSHKNEEWRGYAAMVAAMYTKDLLHQIAPNRVEAEKKIGDLLSDYRDIAREHRDVAKEHRDIVMEDIQFQEEEKRRQEEEICHQLFRLTRSDRDATYEWYKDRVENRVENTCLWFLQHEHFQSWVKQDSGPLLVSADPGCGKSVLTKYLVDEVLPRSETAICYFFFKDQDQNTVRQALCAVLHQLFTQKPCLIKYAVKEYRKDGPGLTNSTKSLWQILQDATRDPQAESVIIVLDALDECTEYELPDLIRQVESQFRSDQCGKLKYLLTCRPYEAIMSKFYNLKGAFPEIHIPGEEESEAISHEIDHVIQHRLNQLSKTKSLSANITEYLETRLQETPHRTYLWVYLIFDYLEEEDFKKTLKGVESTLITLPRSVNEAYERILSKSKDDPMVRRVLTIIFGAKRPLEVEEMNEAVNLDVSSRTIDYETKEDFRSRLRSWCGLFISIHDDHVYFLHQTAREFLHQSSPLAMVPVASERWQHSISAHQAQAVLAEICQAYLLHILDVLKSDIDCIDLGEVSRCLNGEKPLLYYVASHIQQFRTLKEAALPGSALQAAASMEAADDLNQLAEVLGDYFLKMNEEETHGDDAVFVFELALDIFKMAIYSMPQDHPSRAIMLENYKNNYNNDDDSNDNGDDDSNDDSDDNGDDHNNSNDSDDDNICDDSNNSDNNDNDDNYESPQLDLTDELGLIFDKSIEILKTTPRNHPDREKVLQSFTDYFKERPLPTARLSNYYEAMAILRELVYTTPLDHPNRLILLNSLGDCLSSPRILLDRRSTHSFPQCVRMVWRSFSLIPLDYPDRLIILANISNSLKDYPSPSESEL